MVHLYHVTISSPLSWLTAFLDYQVLEPQENAEGLVEIAANLTTGEESELNKLIQSGDVSRAFQLAKAAIVAVDEADKRRRPVDQDQLNNKRKRVISQI